MPDTDYPEPDQLHAFAEEPLIFHDIVVSECTIFDNGVISYRDGHVEYRFAPTQMKCEVERDEYVDADEVDWLDYDHNDAWSSVMDVEVGEDFLCTHTFVQKPDGGEMSVDTYWVVAQVIFHRLDEDEDPELANMA